MKAIRAHIILTSIRSRRDGSAGISFETRELTSEEFSAWRDIQGINVEAFFKPTDSVIEDIVEVRGEPEVKSQSQRLRAVVALVCKKLGKPEESERVYYNEMERLINKYKDKLED